MQRLTSLYATFSFMEYKISSLSSKFPPGLLQFLPGLLQFLNPKCTLRQKAAAGASLKRLPATI